MPRAITVVILAMVVIYCVVEVAQADPLRVRLLPRWLWFACIVLLPVVGALGWIFLGRPVLNTAGPRPPRRPRAPDDDQDFLRGL